MVSQNRQVLKILDVLALTGGRGGLPISRARWTQEVRHARTHTETFGGSRDRNKSLAVVSAKREYSRTWLETFGNWRPDIGDFGIWRRSRMREKPLFPASFLVSWRAWSNSGMPGWRRRDRTHAFLFRTSLRFNHLKKGIPKRNRSFWASALGPNADNFTADDDVG